MKRIVLLAIVMMLFASGVNAEELKLGTYKISNALYNDILLVENNNNIELGNKDSAGEKLWDVYAGSSSYYIKSHNNNDLSLEVFGTNLEFNSTNGSINQRWRLSSAGGDAYYITSVANNKNIDITAGIIKEGVNVQTYLANGTIAQKWKFTKVDADEQVMPDGNYIIKAYNNPKNSIDLVGANTNNFSNIWMYTSNNTWAQIWSVKYDNGFYTISSILNKNKMLDIYGATFNNYSNVQLYDGNNTIAQKFKIVKNYDNTFSIRTYDGLLSFDIYGGSTNAGTNLHLYQPNNTDAQKFYFEKVGLSDIETGYYNIISSINDNMVIGVSNKALSNNKNVDLREKTDYNYTKWYIKNIETDVYVIQNADNKKLVLDVASNNTANGTNIALYTFNNTSAQKWIIRKNDDGTYKFIGQNSGKVIDVYGGIASIGNNVQIYEDNQTAAQRFNIVPTEVSEYTREYEDGDYIIKNTNGKALDVYGGYKANGTKIQLYKINESPAQIWRLKYNGDGEYIIYSLINPKLVLTANSNGVVSSKNTNSDTQKWFFDKVDGSAYIISKSTGKYLDLSGSNIILSDNKNSNNMFTLSPFNKKLVYKGIDVSEHNNITNWATVANNVDFVVIRAGFAEEYLVPNGDDTYRDKYEDTDFVKNVEACERYNIPYSLYLYSYANYVTGNYDSAQLEATHMLHLMQKIKNKGYYPTMKTTVYFDQEDASIKNMGSSVLTGSVNEFCIIMNNNGNKCGIYANQTWLENYVDINSIVANKHDVWVAQWPGYTDFNSAILSRSSYTKTSYNAWQFTSSGSIPGISGRVDLDLGYDIFK